ncbi:PDZ and LIM domain protein 3-like [Physella acuta]|uniref:PDZ and LIM domain protein 3-like n=1 Tax=Physella acuta TaxID=109671 RepID=UPI0027DD9B49|nr:PDZ and LIM domain protein 3-like [Physella acuta]
MADVQQQEVTIHLTKDDVTSNWGFRFQGGTDFSTPLSIQTVNPGSRASVCGLRTGDVVQAINNHPAHCMTHDDAKQHVIESGNQIEMRITRTVRV